MTQDSQLEDIVTQLTLSNELTKSETVEDDVRLLKNYTDDVDIAINAIGHMYPNTTNNITYQFHFKKLFNQ